MIDAPHDLLLKGASGDESVNVDDLLLTEPMGTVHRLQVLHRVPVVFDEDDGVGTGQVETKTTDLGGEEEDVDTGVGVEGLDNTVPLGRVGGAVHPHVRERGHVRLEQIRLDDVKHRLELAEDEDPVLRHGRQVVAFARGRTRETDAAVGQDLSVRVTNGTSVQLKSAAR